MGIGAEYKDIKLSEIVADPRAQPRATMDMFVADEYKDKMLAGYQFPPVIVFCENNTYWLADGFHRADAARRAGWDVINAEVHPGNLRTAILYSVGANSEHGLKRSNADKERAVKTMLNDPEWNHWSDNEIAAYCKIDPGFVASRRQLLTIDIYSEKSRERTYRTKHGTIAKMRTGNIGRKKKSVSEKLSENIRERIKDTSLVDAKESSQLFMLANLPEEKQGEVIGKIESGEAASIASARRQLMREEVAGITPPVGRWQIIYADPPWEYQSGLDIHGAALRHYNTMTIDELCELPIKDIADENAVLFLWSTSPKLPEAMRIIPAWGFEYKTSFVWDKVKHVMGNYNSVRHEFLLIGVRGSYPKQSNTLLDSVVTIERTEEHSEKPERFRKIIDEMYPSGKRIELFSRKQVEGWDMWGAEV